MPTPAILGELTARGLVQDLTAPEELGRLLDSERVRFYIGFDPTAVSLHVGNLVQITTMARLQRAGHQPLCLVGGATGMIGDPSGKSDERKLLDPDTLARNVAAIRTQLSRFLDFDSGPTGARMVNNADWFARMSCLDFLRDIGKLITVNYMTAKESVRARLTDREQGISYTEFSYMLLQGYDFVHLAAEHGCRLQVGGGDQWGNITTGIELQRKLGRAPIYGLTTPLLLDRQGHKMGKTASGETIWLDPALCSPYAFYQYWINVDDDDVDRLLRIFSWRPREEIAEIVAAHQAAPQERAGQRALAADLATWVHGAEATRRAIAASQVVFGGSLDGLCDADLEPLLGEVPTTAMARDELARGLPLIDLLTRTGLAKSRGAARRLVEGGGVYLNNLRIADGGLVVDTSHLATESMLLLRSGKKSYHMLRVG
jgi:tyrosyl-tRNA synthetase